MPFLHFTADERSPFDKKFTISKDGLDPRLEVELIDPADLIDWSTGTVTFSMEDRAGTVKVNAASATLVSGFKRQVAYAWTGTDTDTAGEYYGQFVVTVGSDVYRVPNNDTQRLIITVGPRVN
jgi:hypothetical protein